MFKLGFSKEFKFVEKDEDGEWPITVTYRLPTTEERVQFLIESSKISGDEKDRDKAIREASEIQARYARLVITGVEGVEVPLTPEEAELMGEETFRQRKIDSLCQYLPNRAAQIVAKAFTLGKEAESIEGKFEAE